jgi:F0F1-type ATP synthase assembly protein I
LIKYKAGCDILKKIIDRIDYINIIGFSIVIILMGANEYILDSPSLTRLLFGIIILTLGFGIVILNIIKATSK